MNQQEIVDHLKTLGIDPPEWIINPKPWQEYCFGIPGWLSPAEGNKLHDLVVQTRGMSPHILEIGSYLGRSTCFLASGCETGDVVHAVDTFQGSPEHQRGQPFESLELMAEGTLLHAFFCNIQPYLMCIKAWEWDSQSLAALWEFNLRVLFIDGAHDYTNVRADGDAWIPFVLPDGFVCFHDHGVSGGEGVTQACEEFVAEGRLEFIEKVETMAVFRRI